MPASNMASLSAEDMTARNYLMLLYGLFERTRLLYRSGLTMKHGVSGLLS